MPQPQYTTLNSDPANFQDYCSHDRAGSLQALRLLCTKPGDGLRPAGIQAVHLFAHWKGFTVTSDQWIQGVRVSGFGLQVCGAAFASRAVASPSCSSLARLLTFVWIPVEASSRRVQAGCSL